MASNQPLNVTVESFGSRALAQLQTIATRSGGGTGGRGSSSPKSDKEKSVLDRVDRFLSRYVGAPLGGAVASGAARAESLARRGFSGTAEGARFDYAMEQLSRQLAAVFQPVMQGMTYAAAKLTGALQKMDGRGQDRVLGGLLGAGIGYGLGGPGGALAGGLLGARLGGGDIDSALGIGAGLAGFKASRMLGATRLGALGTAGLAAVPFLAASAGEKYETRIRRDVASDLGMSEESRTVRLLTWFGKVGGGIREGVAALTGRKTADELGSADSKKPAPHRDVTPFQNEMGTAGSTYFELQKAVIRTTAGEGADAGPFKPLIDIGLEIIRLLGLLTGVEVKYTDPGDGVAGTHVGLSGMIKELFPIVAKATGGR